MPLPAPYVLADSMKTGTGIWKLGDFKTYDAPGGTVQVQQGFVDFGEVDGGDIAIEPGTPTQIRSFRQNSRPIVKTLAGEESVTGTWNTLSTTFDVLAKFMGGSIETISQPATPALNKLILGLEVNKFFRLGSDDTNTLGVRGITGAPTIASAPAALASWAAATSYNKGDVIEPATPNGAVFVAIVGGVAGAAEPTWPTVVGETVVDNSAVWIMITADKTLTFTAGIDYDIDDSSISGAELLWKSTKDVIGVFSDYTPIGATWRQIKGGERFLYDGPAIFQGDVENQESVLLVPKVTFQSNGTLSTITDSTTQIQAGITGTFQKVQGQPLFTWNGRPVVA